MAPKTPIGWRTTPLECEMRQGGSGTIQVRLVVLDDNGDPLPSYSDWSSMLVLQSNGRAVALALVPTVVGNAEEQSLTIDIGFETADTARLAPGKLTGDLCVIEPGGQRQFPVSLSIALLRATTPPPEATA